MATWRGEDSLALPASHYQERLVQKAGATGVALDLPARGFRNTPGAQEMDSKCLQAMVLSHGLADVADDDIGIKWLWGNGIRAGVDVLLPPLRDMLLVRLMATLDLVGDH
jgi:hypothetical protein